MVFKYIVSERATGGLISRKAWDVVSQRAWRLVQSRLIIEHHRLEA